MNSVSGTLFELGRCDEAIRLFEATLEFRQRVLPDNHPDIGEHGTGARSLCNS
jgi:hypothetical protein